MHTDDSYEIYIPDVLGSTRVVVADDREVEDAIVYDSYGNIEIAYSQDTPNYAFAGGHHYYADDTGLTYIKHRYYDSEVGRFISRDPIYYEGGLNLYNYVDGNPVMYVDPEGLAAVNSILDPFKDTYNNPAGKAYLKCVAACGANMAISFTPLPLQFTECSPIPFVDPHIIWQEPAGWIGDKFLPKNSKLKFPQMPPPKDWMYNSRYIERIQIVPRGQGSAGPRAWRNIGAGLRGAGAAFGVIGGLFCLENCWHKYGKQMQASW